MVESIGGINPFENLSPKSKSVEKDNDDASFEKVMDDVKDSKPSKALGKKDEPLKVAEDEKDDDKKTPAGPFKMDAPKLGNKEPFFPAVPTPYHPEYVLVPVASESQGEVPVDVAPEGVTTLAYNDVLTPNATAMPVANSTDLMPASVEDTHGLMNEGYSAASVSYPVTKIAAESFDPETMKAVSMQTEGDETVVTAVPTQKLIPMMKSVELGKMKVGKPITKPIAQFMASMESELGVTPDRLVEAIRQLTPSQLNLPPEQTMIQVLRNLNLPGNDLKKAMEMYTTMLAKVNGPVEPLQNGKTDKALFLSPHRDFTAEHLGKKFENPEATQKTELKPFFAPATGPALEPKGSAEVLQPETLQAPIAQQQPAQAMETGGLNVKAFKPKFGKTEIGKSTEDLSSSSKETVLSVDSSKLNETLLTPTKETEGKASSDMNQRIENMDSVVKNAQLLAQKGGGEMKMTLAPLGMGEINLKVSMADGRVHVEMVTEKAEVKKLFEQNIHELRDGLAQHNLSMEKMDVSVQGKAAEGFAQPQHQQDSSFAKEYREQQKQNRENMPERQAPYKQVAVPLPRPNSARNQGRLNLVA